MAASTAGAGRLRTSLQSRGPARRRMFYADSRGRWSDAARDVRFLPFGSEMIVLRIPKWKDKPAQNQRESTGSRLSSLSSLSSSAAICASRA